MELFKLLGTIAIDNAEAKKALQETSQEGQQTESKLGKFFGGIGKGAAVAGKAIATGLAAGATACIGLATAAIKSYGDYEQLVGGVETLFGTRGAKSVEEYAQMVGKSVDTVSAEFGMLQQAQNLVMDNAAQAYKTAGLSANEYMESVNGIAAALNQSSASQLESAELANQAVIDMSDNAAKMGTSMEAIQNAYAGFSKQNYTMLDNLKLGYGGTKEEMQRLLADAEKISGIKYDISSFADVTQAIHVMQEEMGIAGTTAAEAAGTIQGSFGMLKGAWSNLLTGLSDPEADLSALISNVFESVTTFAQNLIPRITEVFSGIATALSTLVPLISQEIPGFIQQVLPPLIDGAVAIVNGLVAALPSVVQALVDALPALIDGIVQGMTALVEALPQVIDAIVSALPTILPQLIDAAVSLITSLVSSISQIIQPLIDALPDVIVSIAEALVENLPVLIEGAVQLIVALVEALPDIIQAVVDYLPTIVELIVTALIENLPILIEGLIQIVAAIVVALPEIFAALISAIPAVFSGIWEAIKGAFSGIAEWFSSVWNSLSNVPGLAQLKTMVEQVWASISSHISTVLTAIKTIISTAWEGIKTTVSTALNAVKTVISTAWNTIKTVISNALKLIVSIVKGDWEGVKNSITNILNAIKTLISTVWNSIKSVITTALNAIKSTITSIWNGIKSIVTSSLNTIKSVVSSVWNGIKSAISTVLNGIKTTIVSAWNDIKQKISEAVEKVKKTAKDGFEKVKENVLKPIQELPGKLLSIGGDLVSGLWNGITNKFDWLTGKIKGFCDGVTSKLKSFFGISSPAKETIPIGQDIARGVAVGIEEEITTVADAIETMGEPTIEAARNLSDSAIDEALSGISAKTFDAVKEKFEYVSTYNELTLADEAAFWQKAALLFKEGSKNRLEADKKYKDAQTKADKEFNDAKAKAEKDALKKKKDINKKIDDINKNRTKTASALLDEYKTYHDLTLADEVAFWDVFSETCEEGTTARLEADKKYFAAKKELDSKIVTAEENLAKSLAAIDAKIVDKKNDLLGEFKLGEYFDDDIKPKTFAEMNDALDQNMVVMNAWESGIRELEAKIGGTTLFEEIAGMGFEGLSQVTALLNMNDFQLNTLVDKHSRRNLMADYLAKTELQDEVVTEANDAYTTFAKTCEELGVDVNTSVDSMELGFVTGFETIAKAITATISEALPKITGFASSVAGAITSALGAVGTLTDTEQTANFSVEWGVNEEQTDFTAGAKVEWHAKSMDNASILTNPTIFGYDSKTGKYLGGGEAGNEVVAGEQTLLKMISGVVAEQNTGVVLWMQKIYDILAKYFPNMIDALEAPIDFNPNSMAVALAAPMNRELGKISGRKDRGR